ncbi:MAG: type II toxin-antitoxin system VapC family toxin [Ardenticatenaceae bacterium]|nr:type II toxin-antitoxin system VapC family toxin [Ardenticatenaceae bacterium]
MIVLDASAFLAFLFRESGYKKVSSHISESCLSTVNFSEVLGRFTRDGHATKVVAPKIMASAVRIIPFSIQEAMIAAELLPITKPLGFSLGDRACLALAINRKLPILTADQVWLNLSVGVDIISIRE